MKISENSSLNETISLDENEDEWMTDLAVYLRITVLPFIIVIGSLFNLLAFFVMRRIRYSATSYYMAILGLVDFGVLVSGGISLWLISYNGTWSTFLISNTWCKLIPFVFYTFLDLSVFLVVIMTGERFFAVSRPLHANYFLRKKKSCTIILFAALCCATLNSHFLYTHSLEDDLSTLDYSFTEINDTQTANITKVCVPVRWLTFYHTYWSYIDAIIYSFLPTFLLCIFNLSIVRYLIKAARRRQLKLQGNNKNLVGTCISFNAKKSTSDRLSGIKISNHNNTPLPEENIPMRVQLEAISLSKPNKLKRQPTTYHQTQTYNGINKRLTFMLFIINISFCLFSMPIALCQIIYDANTHNTPKFNLLKAIAELLQYLNHGSNFFLYILSGKTFRKETQFFILYYFGCSDARRLRSRIANKRPAKL